jgi:hypothetical protein
VVEEIRAAGGEAIASTESVAPAVAWLAHEARSITGEMLVSIAGRVARAFIGESRRRFQPEWTIEDIAEHIARSFAMGSESGVAAGPATDSPGVVR